jgi:tetratricopeptide (TPR) repeat protein
MNYEFSDFDFDDDFDDTSQEVYPDFFYEWDDSLSKNAAVRFCDADELSEIIEIYLNEGEISKAKQTIQHALRFHPDNEDLIYDILLLLNDFELWNDLLVLAEQYKDMPEVWADGHRISALLHLGMEEDAFLFFQKMKRKYEKDATNRSVIYQAMCEALQEVDLYDAAINVIDEAIEMMGDTSDFYWLKLQSYLALGMKEKALNLSNIIEHLDPMDGDAWHRLGTVYLELEEMDKAIDAFEFSESLGYKKQRNYLNLITAYERNGNLLKALEKAKEYLYLYPQNYMINVLAANLCAEMRMWEEALAYVDAALEMMPEIDSLYLYKSNFFINLGEQKKAISTLEEGIKQTLDKQGDLKKELEKLQNQYPND